MSLPRILPVATQPARSSPSRHLSGFSRAEHTYLLASFDQQTCQSAKRKKISQNHRILPRQAQLVYIGFLSSVPNSMSFEEVECNFGLFLYGIPKYLEGQLPGRDLGIHLSTHQVKILFYLPLIGPHTCCQFESIWSKVIDVYPNFFLS